MDESFWNEHANLDDSWAKTGAGIWVPTRIVVAHATITFLVLALFSADLRRSAESGWPLALEDWPQVVRYVLEIVGAYLVVFATARRALTKMPLDLLSPTRDLAGGTAGLRRLEALAMPLRARADETAEAA